MMFSDVFLDEIRHRLKISTVVADYVIWDKRKSQPGRGDYWACCPFHGEKSPSFHADDRKGIYHCFGCGVTGDCYRFLTEKAGMTFPRAVERCAHLAGIPMPAGVGVESPEERRAREDRLESDRQAMQSRRDADEREREKERAARTQSAADIWAETVPIKGTHGDAYFVARGIAPVSDWPWDPSDAIRFHPGLVSEKDRDAGKFPAVVCKVVDAWGDLIAVWQIFLDRTKPAKAPIELPKLGRGPAAGGAIRIGGDAPDIDISEGVESALGSWELHGYVRPSWSVMSASFMNSWEPPDFIKIVRTNPDGDRGKLTKDGKLHDPRGMSAAREMHKRLVGVGIRNPINETSRHGDSLDLLVAKKRQEGKLQEDTNGARR